MKNVTKAAIAGGIGVALLVGGAGTVAFWTDEIDAGTGIITAGTLDLGTAAGGTWMVSHVGDEEGDSATPVEFDPTTDRIVPGDLLTYTQSVSVTLEGENIAAEFDGSIEVSAASGDENDVALAAAIEAENLTAAGLSGATAPLRLDGETLRGEGTGNFEVATTIAFPRGESGEYNGAQLGELNFSVGYTLTQVPGI